MAQLYEAQNDIFSLLPVKIYRHDLTGSYIYSPLHWHRSVELTITLTGSIRFNTGSNDFDFSESDWILVNSCELHSSRYIAPSDHFTGISILISIPFIEKWFGKDMFFYNPGDQAVTEQIRVLAEDIFNMDKEDSAYSFLLMSKVYEVFALLSKHCIKSNVVYSVPTKQTSAEATRLTEYIEQHYQEGLSLADVAANFKYSPNYFSKYFKDTLGVNFHAYLNFVRVSHAAEQMSSGHANLTTCAFNNGFPNIKSFINTFKKLYGCTPGAFVASLKH